MSLSSLANSATARRLDFAPAGKIPETRSEIAAAAATPPVPLVPVPVPELEPGIVRGPLARGPVRAPAPAPAPAPAHAAPAVTPQQLDTTLNVLFGYIPTEVLTLYVAFLAAFSDIRDVVDTMSLFIGFLIATPIIFWLVYAAKLKSRGKNLPLSPAAWPVWEMIAATVAFAAWAFALPEPPARPAWYTAAISSLAVLVVSTLLGLLAPFFQRPIEPS